MRLRVKQRAEALVRSRRIGGVRGQCSEHSQRGDNGRYRPTLSRPGHQP